MVGARDDMIFGRSGQCGAHRLVIVRKWLMTIFGRAAALDRDADTAESRAVEGKAEGWCGYDCGLNAPMGALSTPPTGGYGRLLPLA